MKTMVLRVIAEPPQIFWAPILPAAGNVMFNFTLMIFGTLFFNLNPIPFFVTLLISHGVLAGYAARDPHISNLATAWMETRRRSRNLIPAAGNKYVA
jgi:type IV secretory pathway VirB3-like protein